MAKEKVSSFDKTPNENHFYRNYELMFYSNCTMNQIEDEVQLEKVLQQRGTWIFADPGAKDEILHRTRSIDSIYTLKHFNLRRPARSIDLKKRKIIFNEMYLIHLK